MTNVLYYILQYYIPVYAYPNIIVIVDLNFLFPVSEQQVLTNWDSQIHSVCHQVNAIVDKISGLHSDWAAASMDAQMSH